MIGAASKHVNTAVTGCHDTSLLFATFIVLPHPLLMAVLCLKIHLQGGKLILLTSTDFRQRLLLSKPEAVESKSLSRRDNTDNRQHSALCISALPSPCNFFLAEVEFSATTAWLQTPGRVHLRKLFRVPISHQTDIFDLEAP